MLWYVVHFTSVLTIEKIHDLTCSHLQHIKQKVQDIRVIISAVVATAVTNDFVRARIF